MERWRKHDPGRLEAACAKAIAAGDPSYRTEQRAAEHQRLIDAETQQSLEAGQGVWEVQVGLRWHRQAVELAERLQAEGHPVIRRWKYLILSANNEDDANALAQAIEQGSSATWLPGGKAAVAHAVQDTACLHPF